jgi:hypothetical protein
MNDTARRTCSIPNDPRPRTRPKPIALVVRRPAANRPSRDDAAGWLDRLARAATASLIVVSPRSALHEADVLGPRLPRPTSTSAGRATETSTAANHGIES